MFGIGFVLQGSPRGYKVLQGLWFQRSDLNLKVLNYYCSVLSALSVDGTIGAIHFGLTVEEIDNELYVAGVIFGIYSKNDLII